MKKSSMKQGENEVKQPDIIEGMNINSGECEVKGGKQGELTVFRSPTVITTFTKTRDEMLKEAEMEGVELWEVMLKYHKNRIVKDRLHQ